MARYGTRRPRSAVAYRIFRRKEDELMRRWAAGLACHSCGARPWDEGAAKAGREWTCGCGHTNAAREPRNAERAGSS